jgi:uncharacterized protein (TIGR00661 family)
MLKVLYAAGNRLSSKSQLERVYYFLDKKNVKLKLAAYKKSSPNYINIDYTLDGLNGFINEDDRIVNIDNNYNLSLYCELIKSYNPDIIISDFEIYTSYAANKLGIQLWQVSPLSLMFALTDYEIAKSRILSKYKYLFSKSTTFYGYYQNMSINSDKNFVYSHFCDLKNEPKIKDGFEWMRPYSQIGDVNSQSKHNVFCSMIGDNKELIKELSKTEDCVVFSDAVIEDYKNIKLKKTSDMDEYFSNLKNCNFAVNEGSTSCLSDAYYNGKFSYIYPDFTNTESVINYCISETRKIGGILRDFKIQNIKTNIKKDNKYLHNFFTD